MKIGVYFLDDNGRGDVLLLTPALKQLRLEYPNAYIGCITKHSELLRGNPNVDKLYEATKKSRISFDELYMDADLHFHVDYWRYRAKLKSTHICDLLCDLCGVEPTTRALELYLTKEEYSVGDSIVREARNVSGKQAVVALQISASTPNREWSFQNWQDLVSSFRDSIFIQLGGPCDPLIEGAMDLTGQISAREAAAVIKYCDASLGVESYINHASASVGTPAVILFGASDPVAFGHAQNVNLVREKIPCMPCYRPVVQAYDLIPDPKKESSFVPWVCPHRQCMQGITIEEVSKALKYILLSKRVGSQFLGDQGTNMLYDS